MPTLERSVLDEAVQDQEARVLLHENVINVVRLLLGRGHILRPGRIEAHHLVAAAEYLHQLRQGMKKLSFI